MFVQSLYVQIFLCNYTYNFTTFVIPYLNNALIANNSLSKEQERSRGRKPAKQLPAGCCQNLKDPHDAAAAAATSPLCKTPEACQGQRLRCVRLRSRGFGGGQCITAPKRQASQIVSPPRRRECIGNRQLAELRPAEPCTTQKSRRSVAYRQTGGTHRHQRMKASDALFQL